MLKIPRLLLRSYSDFIWIYLSSSEIMIESSRVMMSDRFVCGLSLFFCAASLLISILSSGDY